MSRFDISAFWVIFWTVDLATAAFIIWLCEKNAKRVDKFIDRLDACMEKFIAFCKLIKRKDTIKKISA
jgi:hypothetical protein